MTAYFLDGPLKGEHKRLDTPYLQLWVPLPSVLDTLDETGPTRPEYIIGLYELDHHITEDVIAYRFRGVQR